jgi:hypothetical protein
MTKRSESVKYSVKKTGSRKIIFGVFFLFRISPVAGSSPDSIRIRHTSVRKGSCVMYGTYLKEESLLGLVIQIPLKVGQLLPHLLAGFFFLLGRFNPHFSIPKYGSKSITIVPKPNILECF